MSEEVEGRTGEYFSDCATARTSAESKDMKLALRWNQFISLKVRHYLFFYFRRLWEKSAELVQLEPHEEVPQPFENSAKAS